jgi:uncharacterized protein (TIGR00369 family)
MTTNDTPVQLPNSENHNCFGCSRSNPYGLQMKFFAHLDSVHSRITVPDHLCGWGNVIHGGILSTILDETMGWTGIYMRESVAVTKTMTVDFIKPLYVGEEIHAEGQIIRETGKREVEIAAVITNIKGEVCTKSTGIFMLLPMQIAKRMRIISDELMRDFFEPLMAFKNQACSSDNKNQQIK